MTDILIETSGATTTNYVETYLQRLLDYTVKQPTGMPGPGSIDPIVPTAVALYDAPTPETGDVIGDDVGYLVGYFDLLKDRAADETDLRCGQRVLDLCKVERLDGGGVKYTMVGDFSSTQAVGTINKLRVLGGPNRADVRRNTFQKRQNTPIKNCFVKNDRVHTQALEVSGISSYSTYASVCLHALIANRDDWVLTPGSFSFSQEPDDRTIRVDYVPGLNDVNMEQSPHIPRLSKVFTHNQGFKTYLHPFNVRTEMSKDYDVYIFESVTSKQDISVSRYLFADDYLNRVDYTLNLPSTLRHQALFGVELDDSDVLHVVCTFADSEDHVTHLTYALTDLSTPVTRTDFNLGYTPNFSTNRAIYDKLVYDEDDPNIAYLLTLSWKGYDNPNSGYNNDDDVNSSTYMATRISIDGTRQPKMLGLCCMGNRTWTGEMAWDAGLTNFLGIQNMQDWDALDDVYETVNLGDGCQSAYKYDRKRKHVRTFRGNSNASYTHAFVPVNHDFAFLAEAAVTEVIKTNQSQLRVTFTLTLTGTIV